MPLERRTNLKNFLIVNLLLTGLIFVWGCAGSGPAAGRSDSAQAFVPGQVLVKLKPGTDTAALAVLQRDLGLETLKPLSLPGVYLMKIKNGASVQAVIQKLNTYDMVEYGEPNYTLTTE